MAMYEANQDIYIRQGDTGNMVFTGLPRDKAYDVYFSIYNPDENTIIKELKADQFTQSTGIAAFVYDEDFSNSIPVGGWSWALKICKDGMEDTVVPRTYIENGKIMQGKIPTFTVDNKVVEGT